MSAVSNAARDRAAEKRDHFHNVKERMWLQDKTIILNTGNIHSIKWVVSGVLMKTRKVKMVSPISKRIEMVDLDWLLKAIDEGGFSIL